MGRGKARSFELDEESRSLSFLKKLFIYLFLAVLGLHCCAWAFSSCCEKGLLFIAVRRLLIAVASHCRARALEHRLRNCGARA